MLATDWRLRAAVITAIAAVILVVIVLAGDSNSVVNVEAFARDVQRLTTEASADFDRIVPMEIERSCAAGDAGACDQHATNASAAAARVEELFDALAQLPLPGEARNWAEDYVEVLSALRDGWRAQAEALTNADASALDTARAATIEARPREQDLRLQFERDYAEALAVRE